MSQFLITGCSTGLGRGLAKELVRQGHKVWGVARRTEVLNELSKELGSPFSFSGCDVSRPEDVRRTVTLMEKAGFQPEIVILNAGINPESTGTPFSYGTFENVIKVNLLGALIWVDHFLPVFKARKSGQFVAISSLAAYRGDARWVSYCASKAGLTRAFEALRGQFARQGITFTTIHLGAVQTGMGAVSKSPFRLTIDQAAHRIIKAMEERASSVTMPPYLRVMLEMMRILPDPLFSRIVMSAFGNPPSPPQENSTK